MRHKKELLDESPKKVSKKKVTVTKVKKQSLVSKKPKTTLAQLPKKPTQLKKNSATNYLSKAELLKAVYESKSLCKMSKDLAFKLQLLAARYARSSEFARYTFNDDMQSYAMMMLVKTWNAFNPERSDNPFAYFTQCIKNSYRQFLNQEKKQRDIRDGLLVEHGLTPSYNYQVEHEGDHGSDFNNQSSYNESGIVDDN